MTQSQGLLLQNENSDGQLVARVIAGETAVYAVLVARYKGQCGRFSLRMLGNREDAEEAMQDAFVRAFRSLSRCDDPDRFGSWLFRILANRCRTAGTRRGRRDRTFVIDEVAVLTAAEEHPAERGAWREEIQRALMRLDKEQREAFLLKHVEDMGYDEMSEVTGVGVSALKMRVKRACERMRAMLHEVHDG